MRTTGQFDSGALRHAWENQTLWPGRLLSPEETQQAVAGRQGAEREMAGWFLCATAHPGMFDTQRPPALSSAVMLVGPVEGLRYMLTVQQCGVWQSRAVMPLAGATVKRFIDSLRGGENLQLSLAAGDGPETLLSFLAPTTELNLHAFATLDFEEAREVSSCVGGLVRVLRFFMAPAALQSLEPPVRVQHVSLTYVIPDGVIPGILGVDFCDAITAAMLTTAPPYASSQRYQ